MRFRLVTITVAAAMAAGMLLSRKLWLTERNYPHVPVWDGLPAVPSPWDQVIYYGMLLLLGLSALLPRPRRPLLAFVILAGCWSLWDQSRWQPWFFQYLFMLAVLAFSVGGTPEKREAGLNACRLIMAATYIWSGVQKINVSYATKMYPFVLEPILQKLPEGLRGWALEHGWHSAFLECGLGICLLARQTRFAAALLLAIMHGVILFCLIKLNENSVVWPWNVAMILLDLCLFVKARSTTSRQIFWPTGFIPARMTFVLFGIMPLFNFIGNWDAYLSSALYSNNTIEAKVIMSEIVIQQLPPDVQLKHINGIHLDLFAWSMDELNVPDYPARRVYRGIARRLSQVPGEVMLQIEERPNWRTGERMVTWEDLEN